MATRIVWATMPACRTQTGLPTCMVPLSGRLPDEAIFDAIFDSFNVLFVEHSPHKWAFERKDWRLRWVDIDECVVEPL